MGSKKGTRKELYGDAAGYLKKRPDGLLADASGRFIARGAASSWDWYDSRTDTQYWSERKLDAIHLMQQIVEGEPAPVSTATGRPAWLASTEKARNGESATPSPKPAPRDQLQLVVERASRLVSVSLVEVEGRQVVIGFDATGRARTLWAEAR